MRWLLIIGVAFDIAGAAVIAWPIFYAGRGELREEGTMRWGRNAWVIVARTREQRFVRLGVLLLAAGFVCQLAGYLGALDTAPETTAATLVALAVVVSAVVLATRFASRGLPRYRATPATDPRIEDLRDVYQVERLEDVPLFWHAAVGRKLKRSNQTLDAYVSHGRWVADCLCRGGIVASPQMSEAACLDCGTIFAIRFPEERTKIEEMLLARPKKENRNWRSGETIQQLRTENAEHGLPLFVGGAVSEHPPMPGAAPPLRT